MAKRLEKSSQRHLPIFLALSVLTGCAQVNHTIALGEKIQDFDVVQLSGTRENLSTLFGDQPVLIVFWATWCARCREEVPDINELAADYESSLSVIGISAGETLQTVKAHSVGLEIRYPVVVTELSNFAKLGIDSIPRLLVIDSKGRIQRIEDGVNPSLREFLRQLLRLSDSNDN